MVLEYEDGQRITWFALTILSQGYKTLSRVFTRIDMNNAFNTQIAQDILARITKITESWHYVNMICQRR